jgi:hypothetical protein
LLGNKLYFFGDISHKIELLATKTGWKVHGNDDPPPI